jgi:hypothetical protein
MPTNATFSWGLSIQSGEELVDGGAVLILAAVERSPKTQFPGRNGLDPRAARTGAFPASRP